MTLTINDPASTSVKLQVSHNADQQLQFKTHPNVDKALWASESLIALRDASRTYPLSQPLGILRWKGSLNHDRLPLSSNFFNLVTCWPSVTAQGQSVTIEYELNTEMTLNDLAISIPVAYNTLTQLTPVSVRRDGRLPRRTTHARVDCRSSHTPKCIWQS